MALVEKLRSIFTGMGRDRASQVPEAAPAPPVPDGPPAPSEEARIAAATAVYPDFAAVLERWREDGYAVLPGFYEHAELDAVEAAARLAWDTNAPRIVVDDTITGQRLRLCDVDAAARATRRYKTNDLYLEREEVRRLALNERVTPILTALLGHVPVLCNSLNFRQGSEQGDHIDALFMTPRSPHHLVAIWVALEDCHPDAGPLRYYPGSHRIPPHVFSTGSNHVVDTEMPAWHAYTHGEVAARGLQAQTFAARKGDVFIWSAYLLHGGSPIADPSRTRSSIVFHYYSDEDCMAMGETIVPEHGGYWLHREHQTVPGIGPSDAPPVPANARRNKVAEH